MKEEMEKNNTAFYEEDEIDLLDVIKPLVKYKLHILLVVVVGILGLFILGTYLVKKEITENATKSATQRAEQGVNQKDLLIKEIMQIISQPDKPALIVENIEYVYQNLKKRNVSHLTFSSDEQKMLKFELVKTDREKVDRFFVNVKQTRTLKEEQKIESWLKQFTELDLLFFF